MKERGRKKGGKEKEKRTIPPICSLSILDHRKRKGEEKKRKGINGAGERKRIFL